ncbi:negative regulator of sigma-B (phosphoserine phosphatase) [Streptohalobacillus salinus]|uniref:Negative regulator of sigma-B (Phosphoserine phosphatase) n=1 Tax=Streptohalobacillus salinus TaxID=621096 RepID=A0A2V3W4X7_9BACI|nr:SpoIIE family protein phosphatase [Streptohalobacillus salinus]PXW89152.1 negative regulator of sigma-B (phosphoserine phosphatase) [Streptohalobacillus salinus]
MEEFRHVDVAVFQKSKQGNYYCGDSYFYVESEAGFLAVVADGLGSGQVAKESSQAVIDVVKLNPDVQTDQLMRLCNKALVGKRGVVLGVLRLRYDERVYRYSSIGNIGLMTISKDTLKKRNIPISGYLGVFPRKVKEITEPLEEGMIFALFSDGVHARELSHVLFQMRDVYEITETFKELMANDRDDDTTLVVVKYQPMHHT